MSRRVSNLAIGWCWFFPAHITCIVLRSRSIISLVVNAPPGARLLVSMNSPDCTPWTRSRQEQIEADLKAAWSNDPVVLTDGKGTPELQGKTGQIN